jgi:hypothetical protein
VQSAIHEAVESWNTLPAGTLCRLQETTQATTSLMTHHGLPDGKSLASMTDRRKINLATVSLALTLLFSGMMTSTAAIAEPRKSEPADGLVSGITVGKIIDGGQRYCHPRRGDRFSWPRNCGPACLEALGYRRFARMGYSSHCP